MKKITTLALLLMLCMSAVAQNLYAPHSLKATPNFNKVNLEWKAPSDKNTLQWHTDYAYDGNDGVKADPYGTLQFYTGARFDAADLAAVVGEQVDSIGYYEYREMVNLTFFIYENGTPVYSQSLDVTNYVKDSWRKYALTTPYTIPANTEVMFALKMEYGDNMELAAIKDKGPTHYGKGDMYSYDGVNWSNSGNGNYLLTAYIKNDGEGVASPNGYNVYCNGAKVNSAVVTGKNYELTSLADGTHQLEVSAVYAQGEIKSKPTSVTTKSLEMCYPSPSFASTKVNGFNAELSWVAPLVAPGELTWSNKEKSTSLGATSKTDPKVWIKNEFSPTDLITYSGGKLTTINMHFTTAVTGVTLWVMKNGEFVYSETLSTVKVAGIKANEWAKFTLKTPVEIEAGAEYAYGLYLTHAPSLKPISIDNATSVGSKGSTFSTSSQSSAGFEQSNPYWKTLAEGNISGNWMMTAEVDVNTANVNGIAGYDVYRDGVKIASDITATVYSDAVEAPGTYTYGVVAKSSNGLTSDMITKNVSFALPVTFTAPNIQEFNLDKATGKMSLKWNMDIELTHFDSPTYMAGFDEDMSLMYGTRFTASELAPFVGYEISKLQFVMGDYVGDFTVGVYGTKGEVLSEMSFKENEIEPLVLYTVELPTPVAVTETSDFYIAYNVNAPANTTPIILDGGPLVTNGAMVSVTEGVKWMKLGTLNATYNNYNIVIGANLVAQDGAANAPMLTKSTSLQSGKFTKKVVKVMDKEFGVEGEEVKTKSAAPSKVVAKAVKFEVYRNRSLVKTTEAYDFEEVLTTYGGFQYNVKAIFSNGWESPMSEAAIVNYAVPQKADAPFDLTGEYADNKLNLAWKPASEAKVLSYAVGSEENDVAYRMTGQTEAYIAIKFPLDTVAKYDGMELTHVKFKLATNQLKSLKAVVFHGTTIEYAQPVAVSDLQVGWNNIRLNKAIKVKKGVELSIGYYCTFASGATVFVADAGPSSNPGYSDMISVSAYSWKSMYKDSNISCNWRVEGVLKKADNATTKSMAQAQAEGVTYNVYCNGAIVAEGLTATTYAVENPAEGKYVVTSVADGVESAESNVVYFYVSGVEENIADENAPVEYFNMQGVKVENPENGIFIRKQGSKTAKVVL